MDDAEKHTTTPWDFCKVNKRWVIYPKSAQNDGIDYFIATTRAGLSDEEEKANAALIVRAVNSYDAMREALERAIAEPNHTVDPRTKEYLRAALSRGEG